MAKTNFTKAEEALRETLEKMTRDKLLELASSHEEGTISDEMKSRIYLVFALHLELKRLARIDTKIYKKLEISKKKLEKLMTDPTALSEEDWDKVIQIKSQVDAYLKEHPLPSDEKLIEEQRHRHLTKRFNVNEKWLPLS